ncbi:MAG: Ig-like domain-containing protein, partial [Christensenellaceae bacterium]|nr:Ig-like domain-containing protein [Christensenellaceae bacterium]
SFSDFSKDGFYFTVDGMYNAYNYRLRNELDTDCAPVDEGVVLVKGSGKGEALKDAESPNVFLVAPYYGHDGSFTDQYKREAQSIADTTGGDYLLIQSTAATGPAIAQNYSDKGVVIYDSHGTQSGTSSYLCLTTNQGITDEDYQNGWAVRSGSAAYIDGRYIEHHVDGDLANPIVWMAICEGMHIRGQGTTGYALLRAGAGIVYGYSQSVTFVGDYMYEAEFWNVMKEGGTVAEAYEHMIDVYGIPDPRGDAYPIVMSDVDDFPANPDAPQTVYCEWTLFGEAEPVALTGFSLDTNAVDLYIGRSASVVFGREPENANQYELVWTSANESIATVSGNNRRATINGISAGTTTITCTVMVNGQVFGTANVVVTVSVDTTLMEALNVPGGLLQFGTSEGYGFEATTEGDRYYAKSNNANAHGTTATLTTTVEMEAGDTLTFEYYYSSETNYDWYTFTVNGTQVQRLSGTTLSNWTSYTYTAQTAGSYTFTWSYSKDGSVNNGQDCVKIDNVEFSGTIVNPPAGAGDVDGDGTITIQDALLALRGAMGVQQLTPAQIEAADMDGDGNVSATDAAIILRLALGL